MISGTITLSWKQIFIICGFIVGNIVTSAMSLGGYKEKFEQVQTQVAEDRSERSIDKKERASLREEVIQLRIAVTDLRADLRILTERVK